MSKPEENIMENSYNSLCEQALDTQQRVEKITKLVGEVHRHKIAAKACQVALTTEVNELKKKRQEYKALEKTQREGKTNPGTNKTVKNEAPLTSYQSRTEANVTEAELERALDNWLEKTIDARDESAIVTKDAQREQLVDKIREEAVKARQKYEKLKKAREMEKHRKSPEYHVSSTPYRSSGLYEWTSPYYQSGINTQTVVKPREPRYTLMDSKDEGFRESNDAIISDEKRLSIKDMKRVMMPLLPGQEASWATLMEQTVNRGLPGEEALALQALMPQLAGHHEVVQKATSILVQAAGKPYQERQVLKMFFDWMRSKYQLSPRQKRELFARKLQEIKWTWKSNPADIISSIISGVQLNWQEVAEQSALREELEAVLGSNLSVALQLEITQRPPEEWKQAITEIWESVRHSIRPESY